MKRLLILTVVMAVAAATGCNLFNRNSCDPCATGIGMGGMSGATSGGYTTAPVVAPNGGYLPGPN